MLILMILVYRKNIDLACHISINHFLIKRKLLKIFLEKHLYQLVKRKLHFFHGVIMFRFTETEIPKEKLNAAKKLYKIVMLMLII